VADESVIGRLGKMPDESGQEPKPGDEQASEPKTFDADYVKELRAEAAGYRVELKNLKDADEERKAEVESADEERLKGQQEWQELAEKQEGKATEVASQLEASVKQVDRLTEVLAVYLEKEMKAVPEHLTPLLEKLDVIERLAYLIENRESLSPKKVDGVPASPEADQKSVLSEDDRRSKAFNIQM